MARKFPSIDEAEMRRAESDVPRLARQAGAKANRSALQRFGHVTTLRQNSVVELKQDGSFSIVAPLRPPVKVQRGVKLKLSTKAGAER